GYACDVEAILSDPMDMMHDKWRILVLTAGPGPGRRMVEVFSEAGVHASFVDDPTDLPEALVPVTTAASFGGFVFGDLKLAVLTRADVLGRAATTPTPAMRRLTTRRRRTHVDPPRLSPDDHV